MSILDCVHREMTHALQAHSKMLWYIFFNSCRYPVFLLIYKENSVPRELKTGMYWANTNLTEAKNASGLALKRVPSSQGHLEGKIQTSMLSFLYCTASSSNYVCEFHSVLSSYLLLTEDSLLSARAGWQ